MKQHLLPVIVLVVLALISVTPLAAQDGATECEDGFRLFEDEYIVGSVCVPQVAERIVTLEPFYALQMSLEMDLPVVGSSSFTGNDDFPKALSVEDVEGIESIGGFDAPNLEIIATLGPDLIIGDAFFQLKQLELLSEIAPTVLIDTLNWKAWYRTIAAVAGVPERAEAAFEKYNARIDALQALIPEEVTVSFLRIVPDGFQLYRAAPNAYAPVAVMSEAGVIRPEFENGTDEESFVRLDFEGLGSIDGDILLYVVGGVDDDGQQLEEATLSNPIWQLLPAVEAGQAYRVDAAHWMSFGGMRSAHAVLDDLFRYVAGVDPQEVSPNPFLMAESDASATRIFTDGVGRTVEIPVNPQRIVILNDSNGGAQTLSLGVTPVGMTTRNGALELADRYDLSGVTEIGDYNAPNLEAILALEPDLIIGYTFGGDLYYEPSEIEAYEQIAPFVIMETGASVEEVMRGFADLLNAEEEFEALRAHYEVRVAEVRALLPENLEDITISVIQMQDDGLINTFGRGWFSFGEVFEDIGFTSYPPNQAEGQAVETCYPDSQSLETVREFDGDIVFYYATAPANDYSENPLFQQLKAVQAGQAFEWTDDWWGNSYDTLYNILDDLETWFSGTTIDASVYP